MKLPPQEVEMYYDLMWSLQHFVNMKLQVIPQASTLSKYAACAIEDKVKVRNLLFQDKRLIAEYLAANPQTFSDDKLQIIAQWKHFISDAFLIERYLKHHTIFIRGDEVYGVWGLQDGVQEMFHPSHLPVYVRTVLLPFKGKIIYDGIFQPYNVYFGNNIRRELKDAYMAAKRERRIVTVIFS